MAKLGRAIHILSHQIPGKLSEGLICYMSLKFGVDFSKSTWINWCSWTTYAVRKISRCLTSSLQLASHHAMFGFP